MDLRKAAQPVGDIAMAVRDEMERIREHHSCIWTSAVLTEVLHRKDYNSAYALTVRAQILNPVFTAWVKQHGFPRDQESLERCEAAGGGMVGLGTGKPEDTPDGIWAGHVTVIIPGLFGDRHAMSDVTITQASKPDWQVELQPLMVPVPEGFVKGEREFKVELNGCLIAYRAFPGDREFENGPLWTDKERISVVVNRVMSKL